MMGQREMDRPFFKVIEPSGIWRNPTYPPAIRAGNTLYVAGQVARDDKGELVGEGDAGAQARKIYENLGLILKEAGADWGNVVKVTTYLVDPNDSKAVSDVRIGQFKDNAPPHTGFVVAGLVRPGVLVEVEIIAVIP